MGMCRFLMCLLLIGGVVGLDCISKASWPEGNEQVKKWATGLLDNYTNIWCKKYNGTYCVIREFKRAKVVLQTCGAYRCNETNKDKCMEMKSANERRCCCVGVKCNTKCFLTKAKVGAHCDEKEERMPLWLILTIAGGCVAFVIIVVVVIIVIIRLKKKKKKEKSKEPQSPKPALGMQSVAFPTLPTTENAETTDATKPKPEKANIISEKPKDEHYDNIISE